MRGRRLHHTRLKLGEPADRRDGTSGRYYAVVKLDDSPKSRDTYTIRAAELDEHQAILKVAKTSKYTKDFGSHMFSSPAAYEKRWIMVAVFKGEIIGFSCVRHKVRTPVTELYFICVHPDYRDGKIGERLLNAVMSTSPHKRMELNVVKENRAVSFYKRLGFWVIGDAFEGKAHRMAKDWPS